MYDPIQSKERNPTLAASSFNIDSDTSGNIEEEDGHCTSSDIELCLEALQRSKRWLYLSHFFAHFSENYWSFSVILFLSALEDNQSLFLISTFGLTHSIGTIIFTPMLGSWVDQRPKDEQLRTIRLVLASKHIASSLLAVVCFWTLAVCLSPPASGAESSSENGDKSFSAAAMLGLLGIHVLGTAAQVLYQTFNIIIERELVVILSQRARDVALTQSKWLSETNATLSRIGLVAPLTISFLILEDNLQVACFFIVVISVISVGVENHCFSVIFQHLNIFQLHSLTSHTIDLELLDSSKVDHNDLTVGTDTKREELQLSRLNLSENASSESRDQDVLGEEDEQVAAKNNIEADGSKVTRKRWALILYLQQSVAPAGICFALLFANCITFGNGILSAFLLSQGLGAGTTGLFRGISSAVGLVGTAAYTFSLRRHSLEFTGMWGVGSQALCLTISTWFIFLSHGEDVFLYSAIAIICISRLGLWVIDITVTQLQQQEIPEQYRCLMGGVQEALNACFHIVAFVFGLLFPHPDDFIYISLSGCLSVSLAFIVFFFGMYLPRRNTETPVFRLPSIEHRAPMT